MDPGLPSGRSNRIHAPGTPGRKKNAEQPGKPPEEFQAEGRAQPSRRPAIVEGCGDDGRVNRRRDSLKKENLNQSTEQVQKVCDPVAG